MIDYKTNIETAAKRSRPYVRHTPLEHSPYLSSLAEANVFLKLDNIQKTGSFKFRGAISKITSLNDKEKSNGVVTASTGNHGAACSLAMSELGIEGKIVVPENVHKNKIENNIQALGSNSFADAAHPPSAGIAPGIAPIVVFNHVIFFKGV